MVLERGLQWLEEAFNHDQDLYQSYGKTGAGFSDVDVIATTFGDVAHARGI